MKKILCAALVLMAGSALAKPSADEAFLAKNATAPGVVAFPGLQYKVLHAGPAGGEHPKRSSTVTVHYEGRLITGEVFDSSYKRKEPAQFPLSRLITGWQTVIPLMRAGDIWEVYIPAVMAYGEKGAGEGKIPPGATLIFRIELISFAEPDAK